MKHFVLFTFLTINSVVAQNTLKLDENESSPDANLEEVSWIAGHWKGKALGGITEEIWSPPLGGSMMFVFRLVNDGQVTFYETGHIKQVGSTLLLQLKHFDESLKGWETKDETVDFKLVKLEKDKVFFEGLTMEKLDDKTINVYVLIGEKGKEEEVLFRYTKVQN